MHIAYARTNTRIWISPPPPVYIDRENVAYVSIYRGLDGRANCKIAGQIEAKIRSRMLYNGRIIKLFEHSQKLLATDRCKLVNRNRARAQISLFNERSPSLAITGWWPGLSRIGTTAPLFISRFRPIDFFDSLTHFFPSFFTLGFSYSTSRSDLIVTITFVAGKFVTDCLILINALFCYSIVSCIINNDNIIIITESLRGKHK